MGDIAGDGAALGTGIGHPLCGAAQVRLGASGGDDGGAGLGQCDGDVAQWCDSGELRSENCAAQGLSCGYIDDEIGYYCQP
ncbi:MAG: hypothetical protein AAGC55_23660 [Myxococcota bacterium]